MLATMICIASLSFQSIEDEPKVLEIQLVTAQPPSPPILEAIKQEPVQIEEQPIDFELEMENPVIPIQPINKQLTIRKPQTQLNTNALTPSMAQSLETILQILEADQLDTAPSILPPLPHFTFPTDLQRRGILRGLVVVVIVIDEEGDAKLERIESSTHPRLRSIARKIVKHARFSPPRYNGKTVKARYRWPLQLGAPVVAAR